MTGVTDFVIGSRASCTDGACGKVSRVIVDPLDQELTHLVIQPPAWRGLGRLVPLDLVDPGPAGDDAAAGADVRLRCSKAEFARLDCAEETHFLTADGEQPGDPAVLAWPHYGLGGAAGMGIGLADPEADVISYDAVPPGEVEIRRGDRVFATDGPIGRVQGLVIDPASHCVTHVLLAEGHIRGRKEVAIPVSAVAGTTDGIQLSIGRGEVRDLPPVGLRHPAIPSAGSPRLDFIRANADEPGDGITVIAQFHRPVKLCSFGSTGMRAPQRAPCRLKRP